MYMYMHVYYLELGLQNQARNMFLTSVLAWQQLPTPTGTHMYTYICMMFISKCTDKEIYLHVRTFASIVCVALKY